MNKKQFISKKIKEYYKNKYKKKIINKKRIIKNKTNRQKGGIYKIYDNIKRRIYETIKKNNLKFNFKYSEIIGCSIEDLEKYLLNKLNDNMTMVNYGEWEIDHIKPVAKFNFNNRNELFECFNYTNLQPLWKIDNIIKSDKY